MRLTEYLRKLRFRVPLCGVGLDIFLKCQVPAGRGNYGQMFRTFAITTQQRLPGRFCLDNVVNKLI